MSLASGDMIFLMKMFIRHYLQICQLYKPDDQAHTYSFSGTIT